MPPEKKTGGKNILQSYLNNYQEESADTTTVITVNENEQEGDTEVTYFVDEEGRYYYSQPSTGSDNILPIETEVQEEPEEVAEEESQVLMDTDTYQTVTLVPSESGNGEVSYVLVVQEEKKPMVKLDIKMDPQDESEQKEDVYKFEDDPEPGEEVSEDEEDRIAVPKKTTRRGGSTRSKFTCTFCSYTSHRRYLLIRHMKSHSEDRPYKCRVCERGFKSAASLQNHLNMHNGVKPHVCKFCSNQFTTSGELVRHVRYKHTKEKPHKCTECDYASVELSKLRRHVRCHTGERPYQCPHCTYASPDTFKLKRHLRTHTGEKPYKCDECSMCFTQSNSLKSHKLIHNVADKPMYKCELCPAKCGRKTDLRIHVQKLHRSDKPLKCKRCGKTFPDRYSCKVHNKTHEGEKCYKCDLCPYASTMLRHLKSHMYKHTDEKPFVCDHCDHAFRQKQLLRRHMNLYHNPDYKRKPPKEKTHTCHACNRVFAHKGNLIRHLAVHDPDSGHQEKVLALKLGREKRVKYITEVPVMEPTTIELQQEVVEEEEVEDEDITESLKLGLSDKNLKRGELVTVSNGDGQQYVVLEVIQLEGDEQRVTVVARNYGEELETEEIEEMPEEESKEQLMLEQSSSKEHFVNRSIKLEQDVDTCFGFDEEEEAEEEEVTYNNGCVTYSVN